MCFIFYKQTGEARLDQGTRTDLLRLKDLIDEGKDDAYLWENHFLTMEKSYRAMAKYRQVTGRKRQRERDSIEVRTWSSETLILSQ